MRLTVILCISALLLQIFPRTSRAQDILLEQDVNADTTEVLTGPNKKKFSHMYYGLGFAADSDNEGSKINYGKSFELTFGRRVKWRVNNFYALGIDMSYHLNNYSLKQTSTKVLPNDSMHDKENLKFHNFSIGFYNRFNFGKRGNYIGNFVDIGIRFDVPFASSHVTLDALDLASQNNGRTIKTKTTNLRFIEDYAYSGYFRMGFNKFVITANYRLADLFIKDPNLYAKYNNGLEKYPELPLLNLGIEMGIH